MKKPIFIFALAMIFMLTQCKKQETISVNEQIKGIQMVLKVNYDSRTSFTNSGAISWSANDIIYVITNGQCVGSVTNGNAGGNTFTGTLNISSGTYDFDYYYVGTEQTIADAATSFTMDFTKQDGTLANLGKFHVGHGSQTSVVVSQNETVTTQATMQTLVAMAYFSTLGMAEEGEKVYLYGEKINNTLTINFSNNSVTYNKSNGGWICTGSVSNGIYVMLVPNDGSATDITFASKRTTGTCNDMFNFGIHAGKFYCTEGDADTPINVTATAYQEGLLRGSFYVNSAHTQTVQFSQGNLQYIGSASTPYWKFADNQYIWLGTSTGQNSTNINVDRDLFGYGANGFNNGSAAYQPYSTSSDDSDYYSMDLNGSMDWGYNKIANGGNALNQWRTLTHSEWGWLVYNSTNTNGRSTVHGVKGVVVLPKDWDSNICSEFISGKSSTWPGNVFNDNTTPTWSQMEAAGCLFLPAAGYRNGTAQNTMNNECYYWSSTPSTSQGSSYAVFMTASRFDANAMYRHFGTAIRLVKK